MSPDTQTHTLPLALMAVLVPLGVAVLDLLYYRKRQLQGKGEGQFKGFREKAVALIRATAQIAAKICSKDAGQRTWARSNTYCPYKITLSHSIGLTCSSSATSSLSSSGWHQRTTREISLACQ